ncbi:MAG: hypothetical protein JJU36_01995, partial [Phycisphaeraceae bacterium]|nr:hypothetical protein [Phycisphaeraceae bacterium]
MKMDLSRRLCCRFACASVVAGLTAFAAAPTHGSLILHDGFPMGDGSSLYEEGNLIGQPGAGGNWAGSSRLAGGGIQVPGGTANHGHFPGGDPATFGVHGQGLGYPGILSEGGHATVGTFLISDASAAGTQFVRREVDGLSTAQRDTGDYYFSLIAQAPDGPLPGDDRIMGGFTRGDQGFGFYIGFEGDKVVVFGRGFGQVSTTWFARTLTDENDDELAYDPGESYFFLARYESSNNRIMTVWANPVIEDG